MSSAESILGAAGGAAPVALVVDDDPLVRILGHETLVQAGFEVLEAANGRDALALAAGRRPEIVLLDIDLPDIDGFEVLRALRRRFDAHEVAVVMITGLRDLDAIHRAHREGANDFIVKPVHWATLGYRAQYAAQGARTARQMRRLEQKQTAMLRALPDALFVVARDGRITDVLGSSPPTFPEEARFAAGRRVTEFLPRRLAREAMQVIRDVLDAGELECRVFEMRDRSGVRHYEARMVPHGRDEVLAVVREVTAEKEKEERIRRLAYFDPLTGMPNRQHFLELLDEELVRSRDAGRALALLFFDLDGFKRVNDTLGHATGDALLRAVSDRLHGTLRLGDIVARLPPSAGAALHFARLGGDEFTVILPRLEDPGTAEQVAHRILAALAPPFAINGHQIAVTASIGIAHYPDHGVDAATLLKHADTAMYHAKSRGRNNWQLYSTSLTSRVLGRLAIEQSLREGLARGEFALQYQPQVTGRKGAIVGFEALLRWKHPSRGTVLPEDFLSVAEETRLIVPLGEWVIAEACRQWRAWREAGLPATRITVNVSAVHLADPGFVDRVRTILAENDMPGSSLEIELAERVLLEPDGALVSPLQRLHADGVRFALDDFGSGYSSLGYVRRLPIRRLKIDKSLVAGLPGRPDDAAIVRAIVSVAHSLGLEVMAEGVESEAQLAFLGDIGCEQFQGYYFSHAVRPAAAAALLRTHGAAESLPRGETAV
jgi:diguanylate cyclase (GGDEF)-like protein